jgi:hypothetical protein
MSYNFKIRGWLYFWVGMFVLPLFFYAPYLIIKIRNTSELDSMPPAIGGLVIFYLICLLYPVALIIELFLDSIFIKIGFSDIRSNRIKIILSFSYVVFLFSVLASMYNKIFLMCLLLNPLMIRWTYFYSKNKRGQGGQGGQRGQSH